MGGVGRAEELEEDVDPKAARSFLGEPDKLLNLNSPLMKKIKQCVLLYPPPPPPPTKTPRQPSGQAPTPNLIACVLEELLIHDFDTMAQIQLCQPARHTLSIVGVIESRSGRL